MIRKQKILVLLLLTVSLTFGQLRSKVDTIDFGTIPENKLMQKSIWVYNDFTERAIKIPTIESSCTCMKVHLLQDSLGAGDSTKAYFKLTSRKLDQDLLAENIFQYQADTFPFQKKIFAKGLLEKSKKPETSITKSSFRLAGKVVNEKTNAALQAKVMISNLRSLERATFLTNGDGQFVTAPFMATTDYRITVFSSGFIPYEDTIFQQEVTNFYRSIKLEPLSVDSPIRLSNINFKMGSDELLEEESLLDLNRLHILLRENPDVQIRIEGHTDNSGSAKLSLELSRKRADMIKKYLTSKGINHKRIDTKGYGGSKPLMSNDSEEHRRMNRRVEMVVTKM